ncbi:MAG: ComEC/Rec2 family competence protein [Planctomycetota bacterium]
MNHHQGGQQLIRPWLIRAPLAGVAGAIITGVIAGRYIPLPTLCWAALAGAALLAAAITFRRRHLKALTAASVLACIFAIAAGRVRLDYYSARGDDVVTYTAGRLILATVRGRIVTSPQSYDPSSSLKLGYKRGPRTSFILSATQIRTSEGWRNVSGLARVTIGQIDDRLSAGQQLELVCSLSRPRESANPGQFDTAARARRTRVLTNISVPAADGVEILSGSKQPWFTRIFWNLRAAARQHLSYCGDEQAGRLVGALIVGERHPALREMNRQMVRTGVAHFLSISGLHLGVFLGFVYLLCRLFAFTPRRSAWIVLVVLAAYVLLAEPRAPLLRSAIMAAAMCAAVVFRRSLHPLNALSLAAIILLAFDPLELFAPGFQLSFTIVGGLILLHRPVRDIIFRRFVRRRGLMVFRGEQRFQRWLYHTAANWLMSAVSLCLTAYMMAAPLAAYHFGVFSPYAPLLSLVLFPLVAAVLIPGYLALGLALLMPNLSYAVGRLAGTAADALAAALGAIGKLPAAYLELRPVPAAWALLCYGAVAILWQHRRIRFARALAGVAALAIVVLTAWTQLPAPAPKASELHLLSVGDGQCAVLRTPSGQCFIFDAGTRSGFDAWRATLEPFLRHERLRRPQIAFVSHANTDHYNALPGLIEQGHLRRVYLNSYFGRGPTGENGESPDAARFVNLLKSGGVEIVRLRAGDHFELGDQIMVEVLWPPERREDLAADPNETSLVLRVSSGARSVLLPGDIGKVAMRELLARGSDLRADVLVAPHHGGWAGEKTPEGENLRAAFLRAVSPEVVLVSRGSEPYVPPDASEQRRRYYGRIKSAYRYYSTCSNGWIRISLSLLLHMLQRLDTRDTRAGRRERKDDAIVLGTSRKPPEQNSTSRSRLAVLFRAPRFALFSHRYPMRHKGVVVLQHEFPQPGDRRGNRRQQCQKHARKEEKACNSPHHQP